MSSYGGSSPGPNLLFCSDESFPELCPPGHIDQEVGAGVDGQGQMANSIEPVDDRRGIVPTIWWSTGKIVEMIWGLKFMDSLNIQILFFSSINLQP